MRIDAILQSFGYADMLSITLPLNKNSFDSLTVWTKTGDEATKAICAREGVPCVETDLFTKNGAKFCRGAGFNEAFRRLIYRYATIRCDPEWICILDSDIVLPPNWRSTFEGLSPNSEHFYGARRYNIETMEQWEKVKGWDKEELDKCLLYRGYGYSYFSLNHFCSSTFVRLWLQTQGQPYFEHVDGSTADYLWRNNWGDHPWNPAPLPPDNILDHSILGPVDPPTGLLRQLPFNVLHLGLTGFNSKERITPLWTTPSV